MAQTRYWAWSNIQYDAEVQQEGPAAGQILRHKIWPVGEEVTAADLGISDKNFLQLIEAGSVRMYPYPNVPAGWNDSPINWLKQQTRLIEQQAKDLQSGVPSQLMQVGRADVIQPGVSETVDI